MTATNYRNNPLVMRRPMHNFDKGMRKSTKPGNADRANFHSEAFLVAKQLLIGGEHSVGFLDF